MLLVLLACFAIGSTNGGRLRRIVGGDAIQIAKVPYQVSIRSDDFHICGGALISKSHVLTAAHCVAKLFTAPYDEITVVTGSRSLKSGGTVHNVQDIQWHNNFVNDDATLWSNDIAIITLSSEVEENENQRAILLPIQRVPSGVTGIMSGFGRISSSAYLPSSTLRAINTTILSSTTCKEYAIGNKILDTQICGMQPEGAGMCKGDSGGPLVYDGRIVGISSWNWPHPCGSGIPDVYTDVYDYLDFIDNIINHTQAS